ncbi:MAG TPA: prenyltransferase/squalene oxidase repeat-containing protein, partial [Planctomycetaceae bacterium]|nr:prenyltransferase/squalene oxidase repeat-containing protein [Planctomycetaceae bacterium]
MSAGFPGASRDFSLSNGGVNGRPANAADVNAPALQTAIGRTRDFLLQRQHPDGHWCAELQGDTILESEYILLLAFLGHSRSARAREAAAYMLTQQCDHGGWSLYPGGPVEISASVKAYLALMITGHDPAADYMIRARDAILANGGVEKINSFTRYYLAMLGLIPYRLCPAVPPELMLIPDWAPFNIYEMSAWSRTIIVPLSLLWACQPVTPLPPEQGIDELYAGPEKTLPAKFRGVNTEGAAGWIDWAAFFQRVDGAIKWCEGRGVKPARKRAIKLAERWILDRLADSDGLGAIFPPIIWTIIGLRCLGYPDDSPIIQDQLNELEKLIIREDELVRLQPCMSPVWDTAIALIALRDAGVPRTDPTICRARDWLLSKEVRVKGDWSRYRPETEPGGWFFEYRNAFYPDVDDTAMVLIAFSRLLPEGQGADWSLEWLSDGRGGNQLALSGRSSSAGSAIRELEQLQPLLDAVRRGVGWLKALQSKDGGWGAFDADNTREVFTKVPFADHNAMIDPSTADITARILEAFGGLNLTSSTSRDWLQRALEFVWNDQCPDSAWFGRWGVNYLY